MAKINEALIDNAVKSIIFKCSYAGVNGVEVRLKTETEIEPAKKGGESRSIKGKYIADTGHLPHSDFTSAMRKLLKHFFRAHDIKIEEGLNDYNVVALHIDGDLYLNQARVKMTVKKKVDKTKKLITIGPSSQITLGQDSLYDKWEQLLDDVKNAVNESKLYIAGKHMDDNKPLALQLDLFKPIKSKSAPLGEPVPDKKKKTTKKKPETVTTSAGDGNVTVNIPRQGFQSPLAIAN